MKPSPKLIAPIAVLASAITLTGVMIAARPEVESQQPPRPMPPVRVVTAQPEDARLWVSAQGTAEPRTESELVTEVAGRIVWVSPELASGGFFGEGDPLARIDPRDYEVALDGARAALARTRANLTHAKANLARQQSMQKSGASSTALLDDAIYARDSAAAGVREAEVAVRRAELDLERSEIRAPFAGRVREKRVDVGQFVSRGVAVARVYATDYVEIRLPIHDGDLAHLDLPTGSHTSGSHTSGSHTSGSHTSGSHTSGSHTGGSRSGEVADAAPGPQVVISARVAGRELTWQGRIVRTEGALDPRSRMTHVVARIDDPAGLEGPGRLPLPIGLFVDASIEGRMAHDVFPIPRAALRRGNELLVVDPEGRLRIRRVDVLRSDRQRSWVQGGLVAGEHVVTTPLDVVTEGMPVRIVEVDDTPGAAPAEPAPANVASPAAPPRKTRARSEEDRPS